jgi:hypothetical protein
MSFADVMVCTINRALAVTEEALDCVGRCETASLDILAGVPL